MPGTTATQGLIYPVSTDRACDGALQVETLAKGIDLRLGVLESTVDRGAEPRCVVVEAVYESGLAQGGTITWNTVQTDSAGAFDASISGTTLTLPYEAPGQLWEIGCYVEMSIDTTTLTPATDYKWSVELELYTQAGVKVYDFSLGDTGGVVTSASVGTAGQSQVVFHETTGNDTISVGFLAPGSNYTLDYALLWAIQVSEA